MPLWGDGYPYTDDERSQMLGLDAAKAAMKMFRDQKCRAYKVEPFAYGDLDPQDRAFLMGIDAAYSKLSHIVGQVGFTFYQAARARRQ